MSTPSTPVLPAMPRGLRISASLALLAVAFVYAFHVVFSRSLSQDEGYLMITIQSFIEGQPLYDSVFTQYGPFYYIYEGLLRGWLGIPLTHDVTRFFCVFHWLSAAAVLGLAARQITRSFLAGALVFMQAVVHLTALASEPGHPQELVALLLAFGLLIGAGKTGPGRFGLLAVITALLAFTKINVGIFFGLALALTLHGHARNRFSGPLFSWLIGSVGAVLPFVLMRGHLGAEWCRNYGVIASCTVTAAFLLAKNRSDQERFRAADCLRILAGFLIPSALILGVVAWTGTSLQGLVNGLFLTPLKMPGVALLPLPLSTGSVINAVTALLVAGFVRYGTNRGPGPDTAGGHEPGIVEPLILALKAAFGLLGVFLFLGEPKAQFAWLSPWVWLVLVPTGPKSPGAGHQAFPRIFLALTAAWQGLQGYPIAGTQMTTATFLFPVAFALSLADVCTGIRHWPRLLPLRNRWAHLPPRSLGLARVLGVIGLVYLFANRWCDLGEIRRVYASLPALDLPGSRYVHMDAETTEMYRELSAYLERECDMFVTYPGINSLYFWTGKRPPTHLNSTGWGQLSHAQQDYILTGLRQARRPLLVVVAAAAQSWSQGAPAPILPLVRCVTEDCREVKRIGRFILLVPSRTAQTAGRD